MLWTLSILFVCISSAQHQQQHLHHHYDYHLRLHFPLCRHTHAHSLSLIFVTLECSVVISTEEWTHMSRFVFQLWWCCFSTWGFVIEHHSHHSNWLRINWFNFYIFMKFTCIAKTKIQKRKIRGFAKRIKKCLLNCNALLSSIDTIFDICCVFCSSSFASTKLFINP